MAQKYELITELYEENIKSLTQRPENFTTFLRSACCNYKFRFDEQLLIYSQRPDATAVLEFEIWNKRFGRWVNKGATGIAVFDDEHNKNSRLKHYFDISDTHESSMSRPVPIWDMRPEYESEVIESLENSFGELKDKKTFKAALFSAAKNLVIDNIADYIEALENCKENSLLAGFTNEKIEAIYSGTLVNTVSFMLAARCGLDVDYYFSTQDFKDITKFNTRETLNALGIATSDIAEMGLSEIASTVRNLQKNKIHTIANAENGIYNVGTSEKTNERIEDNGINVHNAGRLQIAEPTTSAGGNTSEPWKIRSPAQEIHQGASQSAIYKPLDLGQAKLPLDGHRADSGGENGANNLADENIGGRDGAAKRGRPDEMGGADEQYSAPSRGNDTSGIDIQLNTKTIENAGGEKLPAFLHENENTEPPKPLSSFAQQTTMLDFMTNDAESTKPFTLFKAFQISQQIIDEVLCSGGDDKKSPLHICAYYMKNKPSASNVAFLKKEYETGGKGFFIGADKISIWFNNDGIRIAEGETIDTRNSTLLSWENVDKRIKELLELGRYLPQNELDIVADNECSEIAESVWNLCADFDDDVRAKNAYMPIIGEVLTARGGFPSNVISITALLKSPESLRNIISEMNTFIAAYEKDRDILRFHYHRPFEILERLQDLQLEPREFKAEQNFSIDSKRFITNDEIDEILTGGKGVQERNFKTYSFFLENHTAKEKTDFTRKSHGIGGSYGGEFNKSSDGKGLFYSRGSILEPYAKVLLPWSKVAKRIDELIAQNRFMNAESLAYIPTYEKKELAYSVFFFYTNLPQEIPHPYPYGFGLYDAVPLIIEQLESPEKISEILSTMAMVMETTKPDDRYYEIRKDGYRDLKAYQNGTYSLFKGMKKQELAAVVVKAETSLSFTAKIENLINSAKGCAGYLAFKADIDSLVRDKNGDSIVGIASDIWLKKLMELPNIELREYVEKYRQGTLDAYELFDNKNDDIKNSFPFWQEYAKEKAEYPDILLAYQVGDFYEFFGEDATIVSRLLEIHLNSREIAPGKKTAMCGVPKHSFDGYMDKLLDNGYGVAINAQDENAKERHTRYIQAKGKPELEIVATPSNDQDLIGTELVIGIRRFRIESISAKSGDVSLEDITFKNSVGFPINRVMKIDTVKQLVAAETSAESHAKKETLAPPKRQINSKVYFDTLYPEIPKAERLDFSIANNDLGYGTPTQKYENNIAAIRLLEQLKNEARLATDDEQIILSKYVGWGGLSSCFENTHPKYLELKGLLSESEYASARESTLTAFYTSPIVIKAIYDGLKQMGFKQGNILEPACDTGNFIGMLPENMQGSKAYGVELDSVTGSIARQLYQKQSIAVQGFEKTEIPDSFFDVAIGNVPFGDFKLLDKRYDKNNFLIHDYFFAKTLDKLRPGGVLAFITSKGTLDKKNSNVRKYLAERAELIGAIRLPNNAFKKNAGTEVTSDIIFLQKRDRMVTTEADWLYLDTDQNGITMNSYFVKHPDMIMGEMVMQSTQFGMDSTCKPYEDASLAEQLSEAITNLHAEISEYEQEDLGEGEDKSIPADPSVRNFSYTVVDGQIYYRENSRMFPQDISVTGENRVKGMIAIRDCTRKLIEYQTEDYSDEQIKVEQATLNRLYDSFTRKYDLLSSRANSTVFSGDSSYSLLSSLEIVDENGKLKRKADMFTKRTIKPHIAVTSVDTASEALAVSISEKASVDLGYMVAIMGNGATGEQIVEELKGVLFKNPNSSLDKLEGYETADEYLSGNVRKKLATAIAANGVTNGQYESNVTALKAVQPVELTAGEINVRIGATWIPQGIYQKFLFELLGTNSYAKEKIKVLYSKCTGLWNISNKNFDSGNIKAFATYGTKRINAYKIYEETLNLKDVRIFDIVYENGNEKRVLNKKETAIAQDRQEIIKSKFTDWLWKDIDRREAMCKIYNETFNSIRPREYDGQHIKFGGINPDFILYPHQINAIAHIMYGGNTLLAHEVGAGKSATRS